MMTAPILFMMAAMMAALAAVFGSQAKKADPATKSNARLVARLLLGAAVVCILAGAIVFARNL